MDSCIEILREQVETLKEIYYGFKGSYENLLTFSNYTVTNTDNKRPIFIREYRKINKNLKGIYDKVMDMRDEIAKL